jgi:hypothetical protein
MPPTGRVTATSGGRWSETAITHFAVAPASTVTQVSITIFFRDFVSLQEVIACKDNSNYCRKILKRLNYIPLNAREISKRVNIHEENNVNYRTLRISKIQG